MITIEVKCGRYTTKEKVEKGEEEEQKIEIIPKLRGGTIKIMCMNIQGTPTTKIGESRAKIK